MIGLAPCLAHQQLGGLAVYAEEPLELAADHRVLGGVVDVVRTRHLDQQQRGCHAQRVLAILGRRRGRAERALEQIVERLEHQAAGAVGRKSAPKKEVTASSSTRSLPWKKWPTPSSKRNRGGVASVSIQAAVWPAGTTSSAAPCTSSQGQAGGTKSTGSLSIGGATVTRPRCPAAEEIASATRAPKEKPPR